MVAIKRIDGKKYKVEYLLEPLTITANAVKEVPKSWIGKDGTSLTQEFIDYALPLIYGEQKQRKENGLPKYAQLKKINFKL